MYTFDNTLSWDESSSSSSHSHGRTTLQRERTCACVKRLKERRYFFLRSKGRHEAARRGELTRSSRAQLRGCFEQLIRFIAATREPAWRRGEECTRDTSRDYCKIYCSSSFLLGQKRNWGAGRGGTRWKEEVWEKFGWNILRVFFFPFLSFFFPFSSSLIRFQR